MSAILLNGGPLATSDWYGLGGAGQTDGARLDVISSAVAQAAMLSLLAFALRFLRWRWLLKRSGRACSWGVGFLAYLTGFALTATPGKIGELLRVRYFLGMGVPAWLVTSAFLFERSLDLLIVLALAGLVTGHPAVFASVIGFVLLSLVLVVALTMHPKIISRMACQAQRRHLPRTARLLHTIRRALGGCRHWVNILDLSVSALLGLLAWTLTALAFLLILRHLGLALPTVDALGVYPLAMLAGAASMLPGGLGSTEAAIVLLLAGWGIPTAKAVVAAVGIRVATLWFSIVCGLVAILILEWRSRLS